MCKGESSDSSDEQFQIEQFQQNVNGEQNDILHVFGKKISYDIETELINKDNPKHNPRIVIAVAFNGTTLYRIAAKDLKDFIETHRKSKFICHNAVFDICQTGNNIDDLTFKYEIAEEERYTQNTQYFKKFRSPCRRS